MKIVRKNFKDIFLLRTMILILDGFTFYRKMYRVLIHHLFDLEGLQAIT
jgi:hypothetical protein